MKWFILIASTFLALNVMAADRPYLKYYYDRPTNPDNGGAIISHGDMAGLSKDDNYMNVSVLFDNPTEEFKRQGGWMSGVRNVRLVISLDPVRSSDSKSGIATVTYAEGHREGLPVNCYFYKSNLASCYFNGFDSVVFGF